MPFFHKHYVDFLIYTLVFLIGVLLTVIAIIPPSPFAVLGIRTVAPTPTIEEESQDVLEKIEYSTPTPKYEEQPKAQPIVQKPVKPQDPIVDCQFVHVGTKPMRKSECDVSNECVIDGKYYVYNSEAKCRQDQESYWKNKKNENSAEINSQKVLESVKSNIKAQTAQLCLVNAKTEADSCSKSCLDEATQGVGICNFGRDNNVWGGEDRYEECTQEVFAKQQTCYDSCTNTMNSKQNQCIEEQKTK